MYATRAGEGPEGDPTTNPDDPFVPIFREHTELQMLASRFHAIAAQVARGETVPASDLAEGVEVHERFLVGVHHRRESMIASAVGTSAGAAVSSAFERCQREHPKAVRFETEARALLGVRPFGSAQLNAVVELFQREADRIVEHDRDEDEAIHQIVHHSIAPSIRATLVRGSREIAGDSAAAEERLSSWTSRGNPSSD